MKRKNIILVSLLIFSGLFAIQSCKKEDNTTFTTKQAFTQPAATSPVVRADGTVLFTGTTVDLTWASVNTGGDAVAWDVYFGTGKQPALYQEGVTANTIAVPVVDGQTYFWKVSTVDSRGIRTTSATNKFIAVDGTTINPKMKVSLSCTTDVLSAIGTDLKPDDVVDLRLLVLNKSDLSVKATIDAAGAAEVYEGFAALDNGDYILAVDIFATINAGDLNAPVTLSLALDFFQLGMINEKLEFPNVMDNVNPCDKYRTHLANVTKAGPVYTIEKEVDYWVNPSLSNPLSLVGTWMGTDGDDTGNGGTPYASEVVTTYSGGKLYITGLGRGWMQGWWGEVIITETPVEAVVNFATGKITIALQPIMTTTYNGVPQAAYSVVTGTKGVGTGSTFSMGCNYPAIHLEYDFKQGADFIAYKYTYYNFWTADLTLDPAGKKAFMHDYHKFQNSRIPVK